MPDFSISVSGNVKIVICVLLFVLLLVVYIREGQSGVRSFLSWCSSLLGTWRNGPSKRDERDARDQDSYDDDRSSDVRP